MPTTGFYYVYILRDVATGQHHYTGVTQDLHERLARHNSGQVPHTAKYAPWHIETTIAFRDKKKAYDYESYLKSGGGVKGLPWPSSGWEGGAPGSGFGVGAPLIAARARVDKEERCPGCEED